jgi:hypothetical protein
LQASPTSKLNQRKIIYHSVFYLTVKLLGMDIESEVLTSFGRIDVVIRTRDYIYVTEFKRGSAAEALQQIRDRRYAEKYAGSGKQIILLALASTWTSEPSAAGTTHLSVKGKSLTNYLPLQAILFQRAQGYWSDESRFQGLPSRSRKQPVFTRVLAPLCSKIDVIELLIIDSCRSISMIRLAIRLVTRTSSTFVSFN